MSKAEILAAVWMANHDMQHNQTMEDYIRQYNELVCQYQTKIDFLKDD